MMLPPIVLTLLQGLVLLILYVFVARAVRAILRDVSTSTATPAPAPVAAAGRQTRPRSMTPSRPSARRTPNANGKRTPAGEIVVHLPDGAPRVIALKDGDITFGRSSDATVQLSDPYTSDAHARIHRDGGGWMVSDLGSTNGTFVNQVKVTSSTPIAAGDQLGIGRTVVEVRK